MSLARFEPHLGAATPDDRLALARALAAFDPALALGRVEPQAPGRYAGWPLHTWEGAQLSVFALGPRTTIPLHDHPGMHVFTRVLRGRLGLEAYSWRDRGGGWITDGVSAALGPGDPVWLTEPQRHNLHALRTEEAGCVFLDLFAPYYDEAGGRGCSYYAPAAERGRLRPL